MELPSPLSSASKYKCAKLTLPAPATRALQLPEVVACARRVAAERARPFAVQDHALEAAALGRPALGEKVLASVLHAASSQRAPGLRKSS